MGQINAENLTQDEVRAILDEIKADYEREKEREEKERAEMELEKIWNSMIRNSMIWNSKSSNPRSKITGSS